MRKANLLTSSTALTIILILSLAIPALAGSTGKTLSTTYSVVNLSTATDASVSALYYKDNGDPWPVSSGSSGFTVAKNYGQVQIRQYWDSTMTQGQGSAVLSSDQPLAAIVQIWALSPQIPSAGAYNGYTSGANQWYVPLVMRKRTTASGTVNTQIMIQNVMNEAFSAQVEFIPLPGSGFSGYTKAFASIPKWTTKYYDVADESSVNLPDQWIGSAVVTAATGKNVAVVFNMFLGTDGMNSLNAFPTTIAGANWAVPQFASKLTNGYNTSIQVQNVSGSSMGIGTISLDCKVAAGGAATPLTLTKTNDTAAANNASFSFNPYGNAAYPDNWTGSCTVTAPGNVVVFIQQRRLPGSQFNSSFESYNISSQTSKLIAPMVYKRIANGYAGSPIIQNIHTSQTAHLKLTYTRSPEVSVGDAVYTKFATLGPGEQLNENLRLTAHPQNLTGGKTMPDWWVGSLLVETDPAYPAESVPIVAFVHITDWTNSKPGDNWLAYQAFSLTP